MDNGSESAGADGRGNKKSLKGERSVSGNSKDEAGEGEVRKNQINLDPWQKEVLEYKGNKVICSGRQQGKSTIEAVDAAEFAVHNPKTNTLIVSVTEDQSKELLLKVILYLEDNYKIYIRKPYAKHVLKDLVRLPNGSMIRIVKFWNWN